MNIDFQKMNGLVPAIIQDARTQKVLMLGFMNEEAYQKTVETGLVTFLYWFSLSPPTSANTA